MDLFKAALFNSPLFRTVLPALTVFLLLRLGFWLHTFPNPDEAYYWLWGQHPALSYYDHPPFQAWVQGVATALFGKSFFTLRLPNLISNGLCFYTYYRITQYLYGDDYKDYFWLTIALLLASPLYFLFLALAWHDHWLITFSLIAAFQFIRFLDSYRTDSKNDWRLYVAAVALGLALLCKYNAAFVGFGLLAAVAANQQWRELLRDRRFYLALLITLSFLLPVLLWNFTNDFQSFRYYVDRSASHNGLHLKIGELLTFLLVSIVTVSPINVWAMLRVLQRPNLFTDRSTYRIVAVWVFAVSTVMLMVVSLISTALYYWNITAYLLLFPLLPTVFLPKSQQTTNREQQSRKLGLLFVGQAYGLLFAVLLVVHYSVLPLSVWGSSDSDPDSRLLFGWEQVGAAVQQQQAAWGGNPFLITTDYRSAAALAYQLNRPDVLAISDRVDQFDFWANGQQLQGRNAIVLADDWHPLQAKLLNQFERTSTPVTIPVKRFGIWIKNYYLLRGYGFK